MRGALGDADPLRELAQAQIGVAPGTRVTPVKVLAADGSGTTSQIICGIEWVTATRTDADPSNDIAVANMSLGGPGQRVAPCETTTDPMHRAIYASTTLASGRPTGVRLVSGRLYSGGAASLAGDDGARMEFTAAYAGGTYVAESESYVTLSAAQRSSLRRLAIDHDGSATSSGAAVSLRIWNARAGAWQTIDGPRTGVTADRARTWATTMPADYVTAGGEVRLRVRATRSASFRTRTDLVRFAIEY